MILTAFIAASLVLGIFTVLPLRRNEHWFVRSLDFPRLQFMILLVILLMLELLLLDRGDPATWALAAVALVGIAVQGWWIVPYTALFKREVKPARRSDIGNTISILSANVLASNRNSAALIDMIRRHAPDIVVTLESDAWWQSQLDVLDFDYPHSLKCPLENRYGMHLYSRLPLQDGRIEYLVEPDEPSMHAGVTLRAGCTIQLHFVHPAPPSPTEEDSSLPRDVELIQVARRVEHARGPVIVSGDLNDVAWSETTRLFRKISGLLDPRIGRGMFNTFHAGHWYMRWPLDHLFHSHHFTLVDMQRLQAFGSDHFPLFAQLAYEPARGQHENGLEADHDDREMAEDKLDKAADEIQGRYPVRALARHHSDVIYQY